MFGRQPDAQLEESLAAAFLQIIENDASRRIGKSLEHIAHWLTISKPLLACQGRLGGADRGVGRMAFIARGSNRARPPGLPTALGQRSFSHGKPMTGRI